MVPGVRTAWRRSGTTVGPRSEGFHNQPPKPVNKGQPAQPLRRPATRPTHGNHALFTDHATTIRDIRCQALRVGDYAVRYTYSEREKRWKVFVHLDRKTYPDCKNPVIGMTARGIGISRSKVLSGCDLSRLANRVFLLGWARPAHVSHVHLRAWGDLTEAGSCIRPRAGGVQCAGRSPAREQVRKATVRPVRDVNVEGEYLLVHYPGNNRPPTMTDDRPDVLILAVLAAANTSTGQFWCVIEDFPPA